MRTIFFRSGVNTNYVFWGETNNGFFEKNNLYHIFRVHEHLLR